jgi:enoyl-CoA hydratase
MEVIGKILRWSPRAIAGVIASVNGYFAQERDGFANEVNEFGKCFGSEDFKEGTASFLEKRKPNFTGK